MQQTHFIDKELILPSEVPNVLRNRVAVPVPLALAERRVYLYVEVKQSAAAEFALQGQVILTTGGSPVGELPVELANFTGAPATPGASAATMFNAGGSPVGDSLVLSLAQPFDAAVTSVVVQPVRINCTCDKIEFQTLSLRGTNLVGFRAYLGVLSTKY